MDKDANYEIVLNTEKISYLDFITRLIEIHRECNHEHYLSEVFIPFFQMCCSEKLKIVPIYDDRSFDFVLKTPPAAFLLKKAAGIKSGSSKGEVVATLSKDKIREIAETKLPDLNAYTVEDAMKSIEGTARNMGIKVDE